MAVLIDDKNKVRYEPFGGIVLLEDISSTVFVDKAYMKKMGYEGNLLWESGQEHLSAPLNVHFNLTNKCPKQCEYCYSDSAMEASEELSFEQCKEIIGKLSEMNVFSVAFGGGEPFSRGDIFEIAKFARGKGIVPNVTTNGMLIDKKNIEKCKVFGHVHVSVDLRDEERYWDKAIRLFKGEGIETGINYIVDKLGYENLEGICRYGKSAGIRNIMFLRFKPFGRAREYYNDRKLTSDQNINFYKKMRKLAKKYDVVSMVDCSFLPMICWHKPSLKTLVFFAAQGCQGGNYISEIDSVGNIKCCSFCHDNAGRAEDIKESWNSSTHFKSYRDWHKTAQYPCDECIYLSICKGGCHCIAFFLKGNISYPDPECPFVVYATEKAIRNEKE